MLNSLVIEAIRQSNGEFSQENLAEISRFAEIQYLRKDFRLEEIIPYFDPLKEKYIPVFHAAPNYKPETNGSNLLKESNNGYIPKAINYFNVESETEEG